MRPLIPALALALAAFVPPALADTPRSARAFLKDAIQGDNSEMMLGRLAARRGASPATRDFGRMLVQDHTAARGQAVRVAARYRVKPTTAPMPEAAREERRLSRLNGRDFDREFARYMVDDHRKDIAEFRVAQRFGGAAGRLAADTLPALQRHLDMARRLGG